MSQSQTLDNSEYQKIYAPPSSSNELGRLTSKIALQIRQSLHLEEILSTCVQEIRRGLDTDRAVIYKLDQDNLAQGQVVVEDVLSPWNSILWHTIEDDCLKKEWHKFFSAGIALSISTINRPAVASCYLELMASMQVQAKVVASIIQDQTLWGLLVVHHCRGTRQWTDQEVQLLQHLGIQLGIAIQQAELYRQLRDHNQHLETTKSRLEVVLQREKSLSDLKSNFLSLTAHEFRTPMTTIRSSAELLESFDCAPDEKRLLFQQIHNAVDYMVKMLDDIRFMSRRSEEQKPSKPQPLNLKNLVDEISSHLRSLLSCQHQCRCSLENLSETVVLDEKLTRQILENLISNAMKYSPQQLEIAVRFSGQADEQGKAGVLLEVEDYGLGIPAAEQEHIYETFYRAKNVAGMKGTGLGLAIVRRCVDLSGGTIALDSTLSEGTCFRVFLPLITSEETAESA
ncbi:MAG: GAF domain-containing sensor histidine kinase [Prochlorotrichaceae cyanobacterium]|jgi:signal transduction histidine kinase